LLRALADGKRQTIRVSIHGQFRAVLHFGWLKTRHALSKPLRVEKIEILRHKAKLTPTGWCLRWWGDIRIGNSGWV
jgi:hypothetical protein